MILKFLRFLPIFLPLHFQLIVSLLFILSLHQSLYHCQFILVHSLAVRNAFAQFFFPTNVIIQIFHFYFAQNLHGGYHNANLPPMIFLSFPIWWKEGVIPINSVWLNRSRKAHKSKLYSLSINYASWRFRLKSL